MACRYFVVHVLVPPRLIRAMFTSTVTTSALSLLGGARAASPFPRDVGTVAVLTGAQDIQAKIQAGIPRRKNRANPAGAVTGPRITSVRSSS
ncbi:MAG: hypothetical protein AB1556_11440 [Bacillota bacterium]